MSSAVAQLPHGWLEPDWPAPVGVHALCTARAGGVSQPPYNSLNLGDHVGDRLADVHANRTVLQSTLQARTPGARAVFLRQVHGTAVVVLDGNNTADGHEADACVATDQGAVCAIMVADCLPVLLAHQSAPVVAAAHAGWRGLAGAGIADVNHDAHGVLEAVFKRFEALALDSYAPVAIKTEALGSASPPWGERPGELQPPVASGTIAWLGPCIGPQAFEVGADVLAAFCDVDPASRACFVPHAHTPGKYLCDLAGLARLRLRALGVSQVFGNDSTAPWCTVTNASRFFSHRRDNVAQGGSGRFAACIWRG